VAALSAQTDVFHFLPIFRNYYAHRNEDSYRKILNAETDMGFTPMKRANEFLLHVPPGKTACVIEEWLIDLQIVSDIMTD